MTADYVTGLGNSRFLMSLIRRDLDQHSRTNRCLLLIDPHGQVYDGTLSYIANNPSLRHLRAALVDLPTAEGGDHE